MSNVQPIFFFIQNFCVHHQLARMHGMWPRHKLLHLIFIICFWLHKQTCMRTHLMWPQPNSFLSFCLLSTIITETNITKNPHSYVCKITNTHSRKEKHRHLRCTKFILFTFFCRKYLTHLQYHLWFLIHLVIFYF